jgi:hypothetical protein
VIECFVDTVLRLVPADTDLLVVDDGDVLVTMDADLSHPLPHPPADLSLERGDSIGGAARR